VPCALTVKFPELACGVTPNTTGVTSPGAIEKGLTGYVSTPEGTPLNEICTEPVKLFCPVTEMLTGELVEPCGTETELVTESGKSLQGSRREVALRIARNRRRIQTRTTPRQALFVIRAQGVQ
jgi:hypothetical protein